MASVDVLTAAGLPAEQAAKSVATYTTFKPGKGLASIFYVHKMKPDGDEAEAKKHFQAYTDAARKAKGHISVSHTYSEATKEMICTDVMNGPDAMDNHIGHCFPAYAKMIGSGVEMTETLAVVPAEEVDWWTNSLKAWGATRFVVLAAQ